jgi:hypothetical protein
MLSLSFEFVIPFVTAALAVITITVVAEHYGTKTGGIIGTLPSTIIIAFLFIAFNKGVGLAIQSVSVVPAEMGVNVVFLLLFALLAHRSTTVAVSVSLSVWTLFSFFLFFFDLQNILASFLIFLSGFLVAMIVLEQRKKTPSIGRVHTHYTPLKIILRGLFAGIVIGTAVLLSNVGAVLSGIMAAFPVIFLSTMLISMRAQGAAFAAGIAKSMIFGSPSVTAYAVAIFFLYPLVGVAFGTIVAFILSFCITMVLYRYSRRLA